MFERGVHCIPWRQRRASTLIGNNSEEFERRTRMEDWRSVKLEQKLKGGGKKEWQTLNRLE